MIDSSFMASIENAEVLETLCKAERHLKQHEEIMCSVSGGSDSDIMIDILSHCEGWSKVTFVFFDTGVEYEATYRHLDYLEERYNIRILRIKAKTPIPSVVKRHGQPLISKHASENIGRLQRHGFKWEDEPFDVLNEKYLNCRSSLHWWTSYWNLSEDKTSQFAIAQIAGLKEFLMQNSPSFKVSNICCHECKKKPSAEFERDACVDLKILGLRKNERGIRAGAYKSCYTKNTRRGYSLFLPLWWWKEADKRYYEKRFDIVHSDCYEVYGMRRTGCAGCPFNRKVIEELSLIEKYEPKLYKACTNMFADSYEYTAKFREFQADFLRQRKADKEAAKFYDLLA